jgi:hypothetical protein
VTSVATPTRVLLPMCVFCAVKLSVNLILEMLVDQLLDMLAGLYGTGEKCIICDIGGSHSRVAEDSYLLGSYAGSLG